MGAIMKNWYLIIPKNTGLSTYVWIIFCILPFYFIFRFSSFLVVSIGIGMILLFFGAYRLSFLSKGWTVYLWLTLELAISIVMTMFFGYVYFALFLAFFIGSIQNKVGFLIFYVFNLVSTLSAITFVFFRQSEMTFSQLPFIIISLVGVILLPFTINSRIKQEKLEGQLEHANKKISRLVINEERQRIARDLHDTLGQKLSLIGLKSDLAGKLLDKNPDAAKREIEEISQTARTALNEVRQMVSDMRRIKLTEELTHIEQMLAAAEINFELVGSPSIPDTPLLIENVLSMCLKETVTNVVKHSKATTCTISIEHTPKEVLIKVQDNGIGITDFVTTQQGYGLQGMRDRLEFVNGNLEITTSDKGTQLTIQVPKVVLQTNQKKEG
jgi:two-component system, NarL family, sensor histidine kinase DesK